MNVNRRAARWGLLASCMLLSGCGIVGIAPEQRVATVEFGQSLSLYGQLLMDETSHIRSEVKEMRVLEVSLPKERSLELYSEGRYARLGEGLDEPRLEKLVALSGVAQRFGDSLSKVADLNSSTVEEKLFSSAANNFVLMASSLAEGLANVSIAAPAVNLFTFVSTDAYRRRLIAQTLEESEPAARDAIKQLEDEFNPGDMNSLLSVYSKTTAQLGEVLESSNASLGSGNLSAEDRNLVANAYRVFARNRDHIQHVTSHQRELAGNIASAYEALLGAFNRNEARLDDIDRCSDAVFRTDLAFKSLR